jgi:ABC-type dipeptide/oligopeptide/nickel transport system ATPase component
LVKRDSRGGKNTPRNPGIVADRADQLAVMQKGKVVEQGDTKQIIKNPSHPYTKNLLGFRYLSDDSQD